MKGPRNDLTGEIINKCEAVCPAGYKDKHGKYFWIIKCHCGKLFENRGSDFISGKIKSCGCQPKNIKDITGQVFNNLKIIKKNRG